MGILDQLALRAAGAAGSFQQGRLKGEAVRYDREQTEKERQAEIERRALEQALLDRREAREAAYDRQRQKLMDAQIADYEAQVSGTGRYAPKPAAPPDQPRPFLDEKRGLLIYPDGSTKRYAGGVGGAGGSGDGGEGVGGGRPTVGEQTKGLLSAAALPAFQRMIETDPDGKNPRFKMNRSKVASVVRGVLPQGLEQPALGLMASAGADNITEDMQAQQSATQFVDSWIRAVSGAAVPEQELQRYLVTYTPTAWDPEPVKRQKAAAWQTLMNALEAAAGRAATLKTPEEKKAFALSVVASGGQGIEAPSAPSQPPAPSPAASEATDPELERALAAVRSGKNRAAVAQRYKQRTGKDLPL